MKKLAYVAGLLLAFGIGFDYPHAPKHHFISTNSHSLIMLDEVTGKTCLALPWTDNAVMNSCEKVGKQ
jgi:hypothetical protein